VTTTCHVCNEPIDQALFPALFHPTCSPFDDLEPGFDPFADLVKRSLIEVIRWADEQNPRSKQIAIGPSEIGDPCDRRVAYRLAQMEAVNRTFDPWAAIVGTALHSWLEDAFQAWNGTHPGSPWATETPVVLTDFVKGRSDLYHSDWQCVIDHKGAGPDVMRKYRKDGPPPGYIVQVQCYGYGYEKLGIPVRKVALAFYPRAGWLRDLYVWTSDYDRSVAEEALARLSRIATELLSADILNRGHRWENVPASPSNACGFCPMYVPDRDPDRGADENGCPGR
jgi:hypothetical protein